jgi:C4-type Zn-finger protein
MGRSACIVCDECGYHHIDPSVDRMLRPARFPKGWVVIVEDDERLEPAVLCSEECLMKFNEKTGFVSVRPTGFVPVKPLNQKESK